MKLWKKAGKKEQVQYFIPLCSHLSPSSLQTPSCPQFDVILFSPVLVFSIYCCPLVCCFVPSPLKAPSVAREGLLIVTSQLGCRTRKETELSEFRHWNDLSLKVTTNPEKLPSQSCGRASTMQPIQLVAWGEAALRPCWCESCSHPTGTLLTVMPRTEKDKENKSPFSFFSPPVLPTNIRPTLQNNLQ